MTLESALNYPGDDNLVAATLDRHVAALVKAQREKLDAALATLQPGWRLCEHPARLAGDQHGFDDDLYTMRIRQEYHLLTADQHCDVPNRTEYTRA